MNDERRARSRWWADPSALTSFCVHRPAFCGVILAVAVFASLSATMAVKSDAFLEGDACTHYMYARAAFDAPYLLVNVWGRPICTGLYAVPAHLGGRTACRLTSLGVAVAIALICWSVAARQGWRWPALAVVFTFAQPLVFLHSFSELTELPFALLMALAFLAYQRRQWFWMAFVVGLTPLSRPEGFGFLVLAATALLLHGRARWWAVLVLPLLAWDLTGWWMYGGRGHWWTWLADNWPYAGDSLYSRGYLLKFVAMLPAVTGPFVFPATVLGLWLCLRGAASRDGPPPGGDLPPPWPQRLLAAAGVDVDRHRLGRLVTDHRRRCDVLIAALPLLVLVGHSLLTWTGKMASNGEVRYMLVVAPFWALAAARGWGWTFDQLAWRHAYAWAGLAAVAVVGFNRAYTVLPQTPMADWVEAAHIADWYKTDPVARRYGHIALAHPGLLYALDFSPKTKRIVDWRRPVIDSVPPDTLLVWDYVDGLFNADASRSIPLAEVRRDGWVEFATPWTGGAGRWAFFHSPDRPPPATRSGRAVR